MSKVTIYQKPTCSKCRLALAYLDEKGVEYDSIDYIKDTPPANELKEMIQKMNVSPWNIIRSGEDIYKELGLKVKKATLTDDEIIEIMVKNPNLIQRPIIVKGDIVVIGRSDAKLAEIA